MKQNVLDVLVYLFENYMADESGIDQDQASLENELQRAGFRQGEISRAFDWIEGLTALQSDTAPLFLHNTPSVRVFTERETDHLDAECRGLLLFLEQTGVLDHHSRELVIDRVMALGSDEIDTDLIKWVVLMVLFNQPGQEAAYAWMEDFVFEETAGQLH
ncbi:MAG: DUF494 family protein [Granulosicoccaceae bacterium]|jgi:Smg protein